VCMRVCVYVCVYIYVCEREIGETTVNGDARGSSLLVIEDATCSRERDRHTHTHTHTHTRTHTQAKKTVWRFLGVSSLLYISVE